MEWTFDNTWARRLPWLSAFGPPVPVAEPRLLMLDDGLAAELGLDPEWLRGPEGVAILGGNAVPPGSEPLSQGYAGHQFGYFSPVLGDGRAHLLGELVRPDGTRRDLALKGSGRTPFSRGGDGRAAIGPVLREFVVAASMHALGIPTTRSLAATATGETVVRQEPHPGAVLTRVASSHLRVGTVQFVRAHGSAEQLRDLVEYARGRHYPDVEPGDALGLLRAVMGRQAELIAAWMSVGFVHGVMNTDNMTLSGETIDYGPCAFLEAYDPAAVFSSIDTGARYRFGAQPDVAAWNLARLAEALLPLVAESMGGSGGGASDPSGSDDPTGSDSADSGAADAAVEAATEAIREFPAMFADAHRRRFAAKLGLAGALGSGADARGDAPLDPVSGLVDGLLGVMGRGRLDFTGTFRSLARVARGDSGAVRAGLTDADVRAAYDAWEPQWLAALDGLWPDRAAAADALDAVNPLVIPRNHVVEDALAAAEAGDLGPVERLSEAVRAPFDAPADEAFTRPAPAGFIEGYRTFCGT